MMRPLPHRRGRGATASAAVLTFAVLTFAAPGGLAQAQDMAADPHAGHHGPTPATQTDPADHAAMGHESVDHAAMGHGPEHGPEHGAMTSALGPYPMSRDASGTAWQPDLSPHMGQMIQIGDWQAMGHVLLNGVYVDQGGPRGGDKAFVAGMVMGMAQRPLGPGVLNLRAMLSPDPFMGKSGYPLLLAAGETADGVNLLVDRQHPHDAFMELSASYSLPLSSRSSLFIYGGLPGEPAYGPPSFMHRYSGLDSPEAPISHHWMDSTHITFGVLTAGLVRDNWKVEASAFRGREPDAQRWDIETGPLDSWSARVSYNPGPNWALQASYADIQSPEALDPHHDEQRLSLSAAYARPIGADGLLAVTVAAVRKDVTPGDVLWAGLTEAAYSPDDRWTFFGRAEQVDQNELAGHGHGETTRVARLSLGAIHDWRLTPRVKIGLGALVSAFDIPGALGDDYGDPRGGMAFFRLKIG